MYICLVKIINFKNKMSQYTKLNFPPIKLKSRKLPNGIEIWDNIRGRYLTLTPEEWVRQHLIRFLSTHCGVEPKRVIQEYVVEINGQFQRADIVVVDDNAQPMILVECKAPTIAVDNSTLAQATRYNSVIKAPYIVLSNGLKHYCYKYNDGEYTKMLNFPGFKYHHKNEGI